MQSLTYVVMFCAGVVVGTFLGMKLERDAAREALKVWRDSSAEVEALLAKTASYSAALLKYL